MLHLSIVSCLLSSKVVAILYNYVHVAYTSKCSKLVIFVSVCSGEVGGAGVEVCSGQTHDHDAHSAERLAGHRRPEAVRTARLLRRRDRAIPRYTRVLVAAVTVG